MPIAHRRPRALAPRHPHDPHQLAHAHAHPRTRGQATAEYALVLLGAAAIALLLAAWAARSGRIGDLFDAVIDQIISRVG